MISLVSTYFVKLYSCSSWAPKYLRWKSAVISFENTCKFPSLSVWWKNGFATLRWRKLGGNHTQTFDRILRGSFPYSFRDFLIKAKFRETWQIIWLVIRLKKWMKKFRNISSTDLFLFAISVDFLVLKVNFMGNKNAVF